jgi:hypothetical protein
MKKAELVKLLEEFRDDQEVIINLRSAAFPNGSYVIIQDVRAQLPQHSKPGDASPFLIALVADENNSKILIRRPGAPTWGPFE